MSLDKYQLPSNIKFELQREIRGVLNSVMDTLQSEELKSRDYAHRNLVVCQKHLKNAIEALEDRGFARMKRKSTKRKSTKRKSTKKRKKTKRRRR